MSKNTLKKHTAAGQFSGYLFQFERALLWLARSPKGSIVGIETEDDVVVRLSSGNRIHEQDKSTTTISFPYNPSKKDLWKTLYIWLNAIKNKEIDLQKTTFYLAANRDGKGTLAERIGLANKPIEIKKCINELRTLGKKSSETIKDIANKVLSFKDKDLYELISKIIFDDNIKTNNDLNKILLSELQLDDEEYSIKIIHELTGWVLDLVTSAWKRKIPAFIDRDSFIRKKNNSIRDFKFATFNEIVKEVSKERQEQEMDELFVKQLQAIDCNENDVLKSVKYYIQTIDKITELADRGYIVKEHYETMMQYCQERWDSIFQRIKLQYGETKKAEEIGKLIFLETCDHIAQLNNITTSYTLTKGTYHRLANLLKVGWHPNFEDLFRT